MKKTDDVKMCLSFFALTSRAACHTKFSLAAPADV
jgi:hypothetical protein